MGVSPRGLFAFLGQLRPAPADSDAELLTRFIRTVDGPAFAELVHRHGPMVWSVCRRRLGHDADAEDAFQAVFLALVRSARSIGQRTALSGWLYRVAYLVSLKAAGRRARHPAPGPLTTEVPMPDPHPPEWESEEVRTLIDAEVAALPEKFRAVVALCLIEGRTSAEAARVLGVPVGTVDSRLCAARKRLRDGLSRRGLAVSAGVALEQLLGGPLGAAGPKVVDLISQTVAAVLAEAQAPGTGGISPAARDLARGVTTMTTKFRVLAALGVVLVLIGGTGAGIYFATAADPARPGARATDPTPAPETPAPDGAGAPAPDAKTEPRRDGAAALLKPFGKQIEGEVALRELLTSIEDKTGLVVRVDMAAFRRIGAIGGGGEDGTPSQQFLSAIYDSTVALPRRVEKLPIRDVLADALAQVRVKEQCTYQVRGSQLVIIPSYVPPCAPASIPWPRR